MYQGRQREDRNMDWLIKERFYA